MLEMLGIVCAQDNSSFVLSDNCPKLLQLGNAHRCWETDAGRVAKAVDPYSRDPP